MGIPRAPCTISSAPHSPGRWGAKNQCVRKACANVWVKNGIAAIEFHVNTFSAALHTHGLSVDSRVSSRSFVLDLLSRWSGPRQQVSCSRQHYDSASNTTASNRRISWPKLHLDWALAKYWITAGTNFGILWNPSCRHHSQSDKAWRLCCAARRNWRRNLLYYFRSRHAQALRSSPEFPIYLWIVLKSNIILSPR